MAVLESSLGSKLGQRLRDLRIERGMSQSELAAVLGVNQSAVCAMEKRSSGANFNLGTLEQLAWALDVDLVVELRERVG